MASDWKYDSAKDLDLKGPDRFKSVRREVGLMTTMMATLRWGVVRAYLNVFHRLRIEGKEHLPQQLPFVLVANHSSHLDALTLASVLPATLNRQVFPVAAGDTFFETRGVAAFASLFMNALPIWRKNCGAHSLEQLKARLVEEPCGYIIFPEGTRSRSGQLARFKPGIGRLTAATDVPIVPCHLEGAHAAFPPDRKWPRPARIRLRIGRAMSFKEIASDRQGWDRVAGGLETAVRDLGGIEQGPPDADP